MSHKLYQHMTASFDEITTFFKANARYFGVPSEAMPLMEVKDPKAPKKDIVANKALASIMAIHPISGKFVPATVMGGTWFSKEKPASDKTGAGGSSFNYSHAYTAPKDRSIHIEVGFGVVDGASCQLCNKPTGIKADPANAGVGFGTVKKTCRVSPKKRVKNTARRAQQVVARTARKRRQQHHAVRQANGNPACCLINGHKLSHSRLIHRARIAGVVADVVRLLFMGDEVNARRVVRAAEHKKTCASRRKAKQARVRKPAPRKVNRALVRGRRGQAPRNSVIVRDFLAEARQRNAASLARIEQDMGFESTHTVVCMAKFPIIKVRAEYNNGMEVFIKKGELNWTPPKQERTIEEHLNLVRQAGYCQSDFKSDVDIEMGFKWDEWTFVPGEEPAAPVVETVVEATVETAEAVVVKPEPTVLNAPAPVERQTAPVVDETVAEVCEKGATETVEVEVAMDNMKQLEAVTRAEIVVGDYLPDGDNTEKVMGYISKRLGAVGKPVLGWAIAEALKCPSRKDFPLNNASTLLSAWLLARTLEKSPAPAFDKELTYIAGFALLEDAKKQCVIGDFKLLMMDYWCQGFENGVPSFKGEAAYAKALRKEKAYFYKMIKEVGNLTAAVGYFCTSDEIANIAAAMTVLKVSKKPTTRAILATHLAELAIRSGLLSRKEVENRVACVNAAWNFIRYGSSYADLIEALKLLVKGQERIGLNDWKYISYEENEKGAEVYVCGLRFIVDQESVVFDDNGMSKRLNRVMLAAPIQFRYITGGHEHGEYSMMNAHDVFLYLLDSVVMPMLLRNDMNGLYEGRALDPNMIRQTEARARESVAKFIREYMALNERAAALGEEDEASKILTSGEVSVVVKWHNSLFRFKQGAECKKYALYKEGMLVGSADKNRSAVQTEENIFSRVVLHSDHKKMNWHPLLEALWNEGFIVQPTGTFNTVPKNIHGYDYSQADASVVKRFWEVQGVKDPRDVAQLLGITCELTGDELWHEIASNFVDYFSYKGAKRFKRTANLFPQVTRFINEEPARFQWSGHRHHEVKGLPLVSIIAPQYTLSGPGMAFVNAESIERYELRYPVPGKRREAYVFEKDGESIASQIFVSEGLSVSEVITNASSGWSTVTCDIPCQQGKSTGFAVSNGETSIQLKAEKTGRISRVSWKHSDKFGHVDTLEYRMFYTVSEFDFKLRGGPKAITMYHDGALLYQAPEHIQADWDLILPADANKTLDLATCFLPEASESFGRAPEDYSVEFEGQKVYVREVLAELNRRAFELEGIQETAPNDRLYVNGLMLSQGDYEYLKRLFMHVFGQSLWLHLERVGDIYDFVKEFFGAQKTWKRLSDSEIESLLLDECACECDFAWGVRDGDSEQDNILIAYVIDGRQYIAHRSWVYASTPDLKLYMLAKPEYTTVAQAVSESALMGNVIYDLGLRNKDVALDLYAQGALNRTKYELIHRMAKGLPISLDGRELPIVRVDGQSLESLLGARAADLATATGKTEFFEILCEALANVVLRLKTSNRQDAPWVNIYLPLLAKFGGQDLEEADEMNLAGKAHELFMLWYGGADVKSADVMARAENIMHMMNKLADGTRMQRSLTYGPVGVGCKIGASPEIPTGEIWVLKGGVIYKKMKKLYGKTFEAAVKSNVGYIGMVRAPMTRAAIMKVRFITREENRELSYRLNPVQAYGSIFAQYWNMGDFDGDGVLMFDVSSHVQAGRLVPDTYLSMLEFQRSVLGYDMMSPTFWETEAPAQYYADHLNIPAYSNVMGKVGKRVLNKDGSLMNPEKANVVTAEASRAQSHGAIAQQSIGVGQTYKVQFFATLLAELLPGLGIDKLGWLNGSTYQVQAFYEVALGGFDSAMCRIIFGTLSRAFNLEHIVEWWLEKVDVDLFGELSSENATSHTLRSLFDMENESPLFTSTSLKRVIEDFYSAGFCWEDGLKNPAQLKQFLQVAVLAGLLDNYNRKEPRESTIEVMKQMASEWGDSFKLALLVTQRLMDISRAKENNLRVQINELMKQGLGQSCDSVSMNIYQQIEETLVRSTQMSATDYSLESVLKLFRFVDRDNFVTDENEVEEPAALNFDVEPVEETANEVVENELSYIAYANQLIAAFNDRVLAILEENRQIQPDYSGEDAYGVAFDEFLATVSAEDYVILCAAASADMDDCTRDEYDNIYALGVKAWLDKTGMDSDCMPMGREFCFMEPSFLVEPYAEYEVRRENLPPLTEVNGRLVVAKDVDVCVKK